MQFLKKFLKKIYFSYFFLCFAYHKYGDFMLTHNFDENRNLLTKTLRSDESFDLIERQIEIKNKKAVMYFIDGFVKDDIMEKLMEFFYTNVKDEHLINAYNFSKGCVPYVEVDVKKNVNDIVLGVLSGVTALIIDGFDMALMLDTRTYPQRQTSEPDDDKVLRGSKDGFVETMISNIALIRRRIRDTNFTVKAFVVGKKTKTDVAICYMNNTVDKKLLADITKRIENINVDSLSMNRQSLIDALYKRKWYNPFPKVKYTERPDTAATVAIKGNIIILVDNSPSAIILPTSIFDVLEEADDYYFPPITGSYIKLTRLLITTLSVFITPLWLLFINNPKFVPDSLSFILVEEGQNISVFWQLILLEIAVDGLRLASLNTPSSLSSTFSIIGAIALSEFSVNAGWFSPEAILYTAFSTLANYSQPSYEMGYCLKFMRTILLITTSLFNLWGFVGGTILIILLICSNKTISGKSYIYPVFPFNPNGLISKLIRKRKSTN